MKQMQELILRKWDTKVGIHKYVCIAIYYFLAILLALMAYYNVYPYSIFLIGVAKIRK
jgi:hypothetical protein